MSTERAAITKRRPHPVPPKGRGAKTTTDDTDGHGLF